MNSGTIQYLDNCPSVGRYGMIGVSRPMRTVYTAIEKISRQSINVLLLGETGTGKELAARAIHKVSNRIGHYVAINCATMPEGLLETELFGHKRGSFSGAAYDKIGRIEYARQGTILFDEIAEMNLYLQAKLLRVVEDCEITRVGENQSRGIDVKIIASTSRDLYQASVNGHFRDDLFHRLAVATISMPSIRERPEDIPLLIDYFLKHFQDIYSIEATPFSSNEYDAFMNYIWPGNVRELKNAIHRMLVLGMDKLAVLEELIKRELDNGKSPHILNPLKDIEREYMQEVLQACNGNKSKAAAILKVNRNTLAKRLKM